MKIVAAIMNISFVKFRGRPKGYYISKVKKCLVYDPRVIKVASCDIEKEGKGVD